ncbi:MAG: aminopeptidase P family protein [Pseudomonadota bacterium]
MTTREKLAALRKWMKRYHLDAYLVPSTDPHQSEYVPALWRRRAYLSGFNGSAGDVLVFKNRAGLWTDGRYFLAAAAVLKGSGINLFKMGVAGVPTLEEHAVKTLKRGERLGVDPQVLPLSAWNSLEKALTASGIELVAVKDNLIDAIWPDRPGFPLEPVSILSEQFAGESVASKLRRVRHEMSKHGARALVLTTLDAVAWIFNIRSNDVDFNPVVIAYAIITSSHADLFLRTEKLSRPVAGELKRVADVHPYEAAEKTLVDLGHRHAKVWVDAAVTSRWVIDRLRGCEIISDRTPVALMKAKKNSTEIRGIRRALERDGVAMVRFLRWLEGAVKKGKVTELSAEAELEKFRSPGKNFRGLSFHTISAYGPHGAIVHYESEPKTNSPLRPKGIYLIDSGGQYLDGTTDITRTVLLGGRPTPKQTEAFTRVLKGHIRLAQARFPQGVRGLRLDTLARAAMWEGGLDYNHGTGHGIGSYLSVHEGPQSINPNRCVGVPLEEGNILSNEPGYYETGKFGIRTENLVLVVKDPSFSTKETTWHRFETLTLCPIDTKLLDRRLLTSDEKAWLNAYHARVLKTLSPLLKGAERSWIKRVCAPVR